MDFAHYLSTDHIKLLHQSGSRKKVLEDLSAMLARQDEALDRETIFNKLVEREQLGSTAMGGAIAIPHCRMKPLEQPVVAVLRVTGGVEYDAPDKLAVKLFFALIVPEEATQQHLNLLAGLAGVLNNADFAGSLLSASDEKEILDLLRNSHEEL